MEEKRQDTPPLPVAPPSGELVAAYLRQHPDFLVTHPEIAPLLVPPSHEAGAGVVDFSRFLIDRLRAEIAALKAREKMLLSTVETNVSGQGRVHRAALKLLAAKDAAQFARIVEVDLLAILDIEAAALCLEPETAARLATGERGTVMQTGRIAKLLSPAREAVLRQAASGDTAFLPGAPPAMLALGSARADAFHPDHGTDLLVFLARVAETQLGQWLKTPA